MQRHPPPKARARALVADRELAHGISPNSDEGFGPLVAGAAWLIAIALLLLGLAVAIAALGSR